MKYRTMYLLFCGMTLICFLGGEHGSACDR